MRLIVMKGKPVLSKDEQSKEKDVRKKGLIILENAKTLFKAYQS